MDDEHLGTPGLCAEPSSTPLPADLRQLLLRFVRFLAQVGHDPMSTAAWYSHYAASAQPTSRPGKALPDSEFGAIAQSALARWLSLPDYQDHATPQSLPVSGPGPSIATLITETSLRGQEHAVLEYWLSAGAVREVGNQRFFPMVRNFAPPTLDHRRAQMMRLLMTVLTILEENSKDADTPPISFQHMVSIPGLPRNEQYEIASGVAQGALAFLNFQEFSLLTRAHHVPPAEETLEMGVIVFSGELPKSR